MAIDFNNRNRYRTKSVFNKIIHGFWSLVFTVISITVVIFLIILCRPWLETVWDAITSKDLW